MVSELNDVLKSGYYKSPLAYSDVDWFADEVINLEKKMAFFFRNTNKHIILSEKDEEHYRKNNIIQFSEKNMESDEDKYHSHLTGKYKIATPQSRSIKAERTETLILPKFFHKFSKKVS